MIKTFKEIYTDYQKAVENTADLEKALTTLIGKEEWENSVLADKRVSIQVLYDELKRQRNKREDLEEAIYQQENGKQESSTQTEDSKAVEKDSLKDTHDVQGSHEVDSHSKVLTESH